MRPIYPFPAAAGLLASLAIGSSLLLVSPQVRSAEDAPKIPRFSLDNLDRSVNPGTDFFKFAAGNWIRNNPVPSNKSRWTGFDELQERNWHLIRAILEELSQNSSTRGPARLVGDFYRSAMDSNRIETLAFKPIEEDLKSVDRIKTTQDLWKVVARQHLQDVSPMFSSGVSPDSRQSTHYAFQLRQGGLGLPDRDYYLAEGFANQREAYERHIVEMLTMAGSPKEKAEGEARAILSLETALARASKPRTELRDPIANYHKFERKDWLARHKSIQWRIFLGELSLQEVPSLIVGQPAFFDALEKELSSRPVEEWKAYLRWHLLRAASPYLHSQASQASFQFFGTTLRGQPQQEPRWQRAARIIDGSIGEALGSVYVERHFPEKARQRMKALIDDLRTVFKDRIAKVEWMTPATRSKAMAKFERFTQKIGHPEKFREYRGLKIKSNDLLGNIRRASEFESRRQLATVGRRVDTTEWHMTPQTVNAYFNPLQNEIVFPAAILQPPFFDLESDDAINYGAIGVVIGHEITHGYDDEGRKYDAEGNLNNWWSEEDSREFEARAKKLIDQYSAYEALPGVRVNGRLTLGENIADLGGASIAYEALQRALNRDPSKRTSIGGFTPEQRFFISLAQLWRVNWREAELRRRIIVDPHSPAQFRAIGAHVNMQEFYDAFGIKSDSPMWRNPSDRAKIW